MSQEQPRMYELEYPSPDMSASDTEGPTLIVALQGYADAGQAIDASAQHILAALEHGLVASFNNDELVDYRSRRPTVVLDHNRIADVDPLEIGLHVVRDNAGKPFLLLTGPEPDMRWSAFTKAVADLAERFGVSQTLCLYSAPMAVPHTRPLVVTAHGNIPDLTGKHFTLDSRIHIPGAASLMLERALDERGKNVGGLTAHVPHYLAASDYPLATLRLLESLSDDAGLSIPLGTLQADADRVMQQLSSQIDDAPEIHQVVRALEQQYDRELERYEASQESAALDFEAIPSGEALGEAFEQFLATFDPPNDSDSLENGDSDR